MGGTDEKDNLVALYPEEHFLAHVLLLKIHRDTQHRYSLAKAVQKMCRGQAGRPSRKLYGWLKREHVMAMSESQRGQGNSQFGSRWICNLLLKENRKINKDQEIPEGWIAGRNRWNCAKGPRKPRSSISLGLEPQRVLGLFESGMKNSEIANLVGWKSPQAVVYFLNRNFPNRKKYSPSEKRSIGDSDNTHPWYG